MTEKDNQTDVDTKSLKKRAEREGTLSLDEFAGLLKLVRRTSDASQKEAKIAEEITIKIKSMFSQVTNVQTLSDSLDQSYREQFCKLKDQDCLNFFNQCIKLFELKDVFAWAICGLSLRADL